MPRTRRVTPGQRHAAPTVLALCGLACAVVPAASAQPAGEPINRRDLSIVSPRPSAGAIDGRGFAGITLPAEPADNASTFRARRIDAWTERGCNRLLLTGDVTTTIGPYTFSARSASVWIEPVIVNGRTGNQIAMVLDATRGLTGSGTDGGAISQDADTLLVTAVTLGDDVTLSADVLRSGRPVATSSVLLLRDAETRFARYLRAQAGYRSDAALLGDPDAAFDEGFDTADLVPPEDRPTDLSGETLPPDTGTVTVFAPSAEVVAADPADPDAGDALLLSDGVSVLYAARGTTPGLGGPGQQQGLPREVQLSAERAVIFLGDNDDPGAGIYDAGSISGVYLEGDVELTTVVADSAGGRRYQLRGRSAYYDLRTDRALILDAVFWTYDSERGMPIYLRADSIRQRAATEWSAERATIANAAFADPHFSIGLSSVTVRADEQAPGGIAVEGRQVTFRAGDVPLAYAPKIKGDLQPSALRGITVGSENGGPVVKTQWDAATLLGLDDTINPDARLLIDGYAERGLGLGLDAAWDRPVAEGSLFAYYINDSGTDDLTTGAEIDRDFENRGIVDGRTIWNISDSWRAYAQASFISDPAFVDSFFEADAETGDEFISRLLFRRVTPDQPNFMATLELSGTFNDFIANEYLMQSQGYQSESLPEAMLSLTGVPVFGGVLSYFGEASAGIKRFSFGENPVREQGFDTARRATRAFGLQPGQSFADALREQGLNQQAVARFDTRHEFEMPLAAGPINIVPFAVGRITAWDDGFDEFNNGALDEEDNIRYWGGGGVRLGTELTRIDDSVRSKALDLQRIRHIIEPTATLWSADTNAQAENIPVYDRDVDALADGTAFNLGLRNTWQTMRGPEGEQRSVDWLVVDSQVTWASDDTDSTSPLGYFDHTRPELSNLGNFTQNSATWAVTDALAITGDWLYDTDEGRTARTAAGMSIDHGFGYASFVEYRFLETPSIEAITAGTRYELTTKYAIELSGTYDLERDRTQSLNAVITRRFPQWTVAFGLDLDEIADDFSVGVLLQPVGFGGDRRSRIFTREETDPLLLGSGLPDTTRGGSVAPTSNQRIRTGPFGG